MKAPAINALKAHVIELEAGKNDASKISEDEKIAAPVFIDKAEKRNDTIFIKKMVLQFTIKSGGSSNGKSSNNNTFSNNLCPLKNH